MKHISAYILEVLTQPPKKNWPRANEAKGQNSASTNGNSKPPTSLRQYAKTCSKQAVMSLFNHGFLDSETTKKLFKTSSGWRSA